MTILCVGDIHIKTTNTHLVDLLEHQIVEHIQNKGIQIVVLMGDILDTFERIHTQALNRAYQLIDSIRQHAKIYILVGNHDYINNQQFLSNQHWMNALKDWNNVVIVDQVIVYNNMLFVPYVPIKRFTEALETQTLMDWKTASYIFAHQEFKGCKMGAITSVEGDEWNVDWPLVISGHIHDRQQPQENIYYLGASLQNSFGDQTLPILLWIEPNTNTRTELVLELPRKKTIYTDIQHVQELELEKLLEQKNIDMIRVVVKCEYEQFKVFSQSKQYEILQSHPKCKVIHKLPEPDSKSLPIEKSNTSDENKINSTNSTNSTNPKNLTDSENSSSVESIERIDWNASSTFDKWLYNKVLQTKDSYLFSMYNEIIYDTYIEPEDILIV